MHKYLGLCVWAALSVGGCKSLNSDSTVQSTDATPSSDESTARETHASTHIVDCDRADDPEYAVAIVKDASGALTAQVSLEGEDDVGADTFDPICEKTPVIMHAHDDGSAEYETTGGDFLLTHPVIPVDHWVWGNLTVKACGSVPAHVMKLRCTHD